MMASPRLMLLLAHVVFSLFLRHPLAGAAADNADGASAVVMLAYDNFTAFIEEHDHVVVNFMAPWCDDFPSPTPPRPAPH